MSERAEPGDLLAQARWLRALAGSLLREPAEADDAVQETWLAALRRPPAMRESLRPWLTTVLRNLVRSQRRADRHRSDRERRASEAPIPAPSPEELLAQHEELRTVAAMVSALGEPYRATVLLCY
ncbi:MAG TPA: sigma-70 family RNA polymerase sigma factor, partial [Polyangia bacterium]|nr:sigma-70 family RNA polymerase sigma factor [Polyangia bacterium]